MAQVAAATFSKRRLEAELAALDGRERAAEIRHRVRPNIYRIALYLRAADDCLELIAKGRTPERAFADTFTPTRGMHTVARHLGLALDVERGNWVRAA